MKNIDLLAMAGLAEQLQVILFKLINMLRDGFINTPGTKAAACCKLYLQQAAALVPGVLMKPSRSILISLKRITCNCSARPAIANRSIFFILCLNGLPDLLQDIHL